MEIIKTNSNISLMQDYISDNALLVSRDLGIGTDEAKKYVIEVLNQEKQKGRIENPIVEYYGKDQYGDRILRKKRLTNYLESTNGGIVVPSGTVYTNHENELSVHTENTEERVRLRSIAKKEAAVAKIEGDSKKAALKDKFQKAYKAGNNAITGLFDNMYNPFYTPSSHYSLTSITATVTSIGNCISESMIAGNRLYTNPTTVIAHILSVSTNSDLIKMKDVSTRYKLHTPTVDDCMFVILKSTRYYWNSKERDSEIREVLSTLSDIERSAFVYVNDLYHLRHFNPDVIRKIIGMLVKVETEIEDPVTAMKDIPEDVEILSKCILYDDMLKHSERREVVKFGKPEYMETQKKIAATSVSSKKFLLYIDDLVEVFFRSDNLPINVSDIKDMIRGCTVLSDTDSTCSTYQDWVMWYYRRPLPEFKTDEIAIASIVLIFTARALSHSLELFSTRMNIRGKYKKLLAMKNEFYWKVMTFTNMTKHYYADTAICEGDVFAKTKLELKGSNLIDSKLPKDLKDLSVEYFERINKTITDGNKVNIHELVEDIIKIEKSTMERIKNLDSDILKEEVVLDHSSYKGGRLGSVYYHYMLWNDVFGPKYGKILDTPVVCIKLKTKMKSVSKIKEYLAQIDDVALRMRFEKFIEKYPKNGLEVLRLPKEIVSGGGIPTELEHLLEIKPAVEELCKTFYLILETLGFYKKPNILLMDLYPEW